MKTIIGRFADASSVAAMLLAAVLLWACDDGGSQLVTDSGSDSGPDATVPGCDVVPDWDTSATQTDSGTGTLEVRVDLDAAGVVSTCAGPPCLIVTIATGGGTVADLTQVSASRVTFSYSNPGMTSADTVQLLLRWRVLCETTGGAEEERTISHPVWVCADAGGTLSLSESACG